MNGLTTIVRIKGVYKKFVSPIFSDLMCEESFTKYVRQYVKCKYSKKTFKHRSGKILNSESPVNLKKRKFSPRTHSLSIETEEIWFPCESEEEKNQENEHDQKVCEVHHTNKVHRNKRFLPNVYL